jgi:hypothetical protein
VADLGEGEHAVALDVPGVHALGQLDPALDLRRRLALLPSACVGPAEHDVRRCGERVLLDIGPARELERPPCECFRLRCISQLELDGGANAEHEGRGAG